MKIKFILLLCMVGIFAACSSDDSSGDTAETCEKPTALTVTNITDTAAELSWTEMGSATTWDIEVVIAGTTPTGTPTEANVSNPYTMMDLTAETAYEFYVRANCGDDISEWAGPQAFTTGITVSPKNYFPLAEGNSWSYDNERTGGGLPTEESEETMTAGTPTEENGTMHYPMETDNTTTGGFVTSNILSNGTLHRDGDQVIYNGALIIDIQQLQMDPVEITINNAAILSESATAGSQLYFYEGSETQDLNIGVTVPVTIEYTLTTTNVEFLETYTTPNGEVYSDVLRADLVVSASASAEYMGASITVLAEQNVFTSADYYANEVGMVYSDVINNIEFEDLSAFGLPVLPDVHIESSQELTAHTLN